MYQNGASMTQETGVVVEGGSGGGRLLSGQFEHWADSGMVDNSQHTEDTSTDVEPDDKNQVFITLMYFTYHCLVTFWTFTFVIFWILYVLASGIFCSSF